MSEKMNPCKRKCHDCGNVADHEDNITPWVCCKKCGSQDTRLLSSPAPAPAQVFSTIYQSGLWSPNPYDSGPGSYPGGEGKEYCQIMPAVLKAMRVRRVLDIGCGDGRILANVAAQCPGIEFTGVDCVDEVIKSCAVTWPFVRWEVNDLSDLTTLPTWSGIYHRDADIVLMKDVLHHWPTNEIHRILGFFVEKCIPVIATQDCQGAQDDQDCELGGFRALSAKTEPLHAYGPVLLAEYLHKSILLFRFDG